MSRRNFARQAGFTLVELMVVIIILGLLAGVGAVQFFKYVDESRVDVAKTRCKEIEEEITRYVMRAGTQPSPDEILEQLVQKKRFNNADAILDPWGERFRVRLNEDGRYEVYSVGKDRQEGTEDDVWASGQGNSGGGDRGF